MNTWGVHAKFDEDGDVKSKAHPFHHMQREEFRGGRFFGYAPKITVQFYRAPLSGLN